MRRITHIKVSSKTRSFRIDGKDIDCRPADATEPCVPEDEFLTIEKCTMCAKLF